MKMKKKKKTIKSTCLTINLLRMKTTTRRIINPLYLLKKIYLNYLKIAKNKSNKNKKKTQTRTLIMLIILFLRHNKLFYKNN